MPSYGFNVVITAELQARSYDWYSSWRSRAANFHCRSLTKYFLYSINQLGKDGLRSIVHRTHADAG